MKKKLVIILAVLIVTTFAGCNSKSSETAGENSNPVAVGDSAAGGEDKDMNGSRKNAAGLTGEVVSVNGREVSLKIIDMPGFGGMGGPGRMPDGEKPQRDGDMKGDKGVPPDMASGDAPRMDKGAPPDMASSDAPRMGKGVPPDMASGNAPRMEITYTGETKTIAIPDGVSITKMTRGDNGGENTELAIGDVKAGDIMMVWFSDESQSVVEKVSISNFGKKDQ